MGCNTQWGTPAVLGAQECQDPFVSDVQFRCADNTCTHIAGRCNGVNNCADGSDEDGCPSTTQGLTLEAFTGYTATIETPAINSLVFYDRSYTFDSLGSFSGHSFVKMSNEDKHIRHSHVQMKLRLPQPMAIYVVKLDDTSLPWLEEEGWTLTALEGVSYHGTRETRHTEWSEDLLIDHHYGPGQVWEKIFPAGAIEMRGNNGGDGSYVLFASTLGNAPASCAGLYEAEDAYISGAVEHADASSVAHQGFTGRSFVDFINPSGDYVEWTVESCSAGAATASFRYALSSGNRPMQVLVNGAEAVSSLDFMGCGAGNWATYCDTSVEVVLSAGTNTVRLVATGSSGANIDSLTIA